ncbi:MAG: hypothetical protein JWN78_457 [Bacteroidota bacterium]|nr:hypothetical protein [Bacteroidota bacterium]
MRIKILYLLIAILLISSCARPYRKINISSIPFKENREEFNISYSVRQGVLYNMKDFFYAKKEMKKNMSLIAFKIVNKSELPLRVSDLQFSCGASVPIAPIKVDEFYNELKQKAALYWLYSVGVMPFRRGPAKPWIYLPFGIVMAGANFGIAYRANKKFKTDLNLLDLTNKIIQPGDSIRGVLPFKNVANCGDIFITKRE